MRPRLLSQDGALGVGFSLQVQQGTPAEMVPKKVHCRSMGFGDVSGSIIIQFGRSQCAGGA